MAYSGGAGYSDPNNDYTEYDSGQNAGDDAVGLVGWAGRQEQSPED